MADPTLLLAAIRRIETGRTGLDAYDVMYGHNKIPVPLTQMTLDEAIAAGPSWTRKHKSSAAGAYQFMNATLKDLKRQLKLNGREKLEPAFQDRLAMALLERRGFSRFASGALNTVGFAKNLAQEWASFPVLETTRGAHREVFRGQSFYAGDGLNKALVKPEEIETLLGQVRAGLTVSPKPAPIPTVPLPEPEKRSRMPLVAKLAIVAIVVIAVAIFVFNQLR